LSATNIFTSIQNKTFMTETVSIKATRREWLALSILILPTLIVSMDMNVTYLALPVLSAALKPTSAELLWITDIYGFLEAGLLIVMGSLADKFGIKKILLIGATAFSVSSTFAAFAPSAFWLIIARAVMGIGGATILPAVISLIRNMFRDEHQRTFAVGMYTTAFSAGSMIGPVVGGFLLYHFWWGSIFLMPVPLILVLLFTAPFLIPEFKNESEHPFDILSAGLLITSTLLTIFGIKQIAQNGFSLLYMLCIIAGITLGIIFIRRQKMLPEPLIDLQLFKNPVFKIAIAALFIVLFDCCGIGLFTGQYLQSVAGFNSFIAGLWMLPGPVGSVILCMLAPVAAKRFKRVTIIAAGLTTMMLSVLVFVFIGIHDPILIGIANFFMTAGGAVTVTIGIDTVVASAPHEKAGAAAGISETSTGFGGALGVAILGSIWTALYRGKMSAYASATDEARNTIGGAVAEAKRLKDIPLLNHAKDAFVSSMHVTAGVCAAIIAVVIVFVVVTMRKKSVFISA
jgi:DHA2 family multidrug resistance protein-like MFS transporter